MWLARAPSSSLPLDCTLFAALPTVPCRLEKAVLLLMGGDLGAGKGAAAGSSTGSGIEWLGTSELPLVYWSGV